MTTMREVDEITARVRKGASLFDAKIGPRWIDNVNLDTLNVGDSSCCPGAQATRRDFGMGMLFLGLVPDSWSPLTRDPNNAIAEHGFLWKHSDGDPRVNDEVASLNAAWRIEIRARRAIRAMPVPC